MYTHALNRLIKPELVTLKGEALGRRLGQHFLFDPSILKRIVKAADLYPDDIVVEIGPGKGQMTRLLAEAVKEVIAIELDRSLCEEIRRSTSEIKNINLFCGDALKYPYHTLHSFKTVANIPYYITTPVIFKLLEERHNLTTATLTIQKEVAERIVASPGGKDYGVLSIMVQYRADAEIAFTIPASAFSPPPRVDSAVLCLKTLSSPRIRLSSEKTFVNVVKTAFSRRRKTLSNSLKPLNAGIKGLLLDACIDPVRRPETLSMEEFAAIAELLECNK